MSAKNYPGIEKIKILTTEDLIKAPVPKPAEAAPAAEETDEAEAPAEEPAAE